MSNLILNLKTTFERRFSEDGTFLEKKLVVKFDTPQCRVTGTILPQEPVIGNVTLEFIIVPKQNNYFFTYHEYEFDYDINFIKGFFQTTTVRIITEDEAGTRHYENAACTSDEEKDVIKPSGEE